MNYSTINIICALAIVLLGGDWIAIGYAAEHTIAQPPGELGVWSFLALTSPVLLVLLCFMWMGS